MTDEPKMRNDRACRQFVRTPHPEPNTLGVENMLHPWPDHAQRGAAWRDERPDTSSGGAPSHKSIPLYPTSCGGEKSAPLPGHGRALHRHHAQTQSMTPRRTLEHPEEAMMAPTSDIASSARARAKNLLTLCMCVLQACEHGNGWVHFPRLTRTIPNRTSFPSFRGPPLSVCICVIAHNAPTGRSRPPQVVQLAYA